MVKDGAKKTKRNKTNKIKILMLVGYSSGPSGIWQRCKDESIAFANKGHTVVVFSSDAVKGKTREYAEAFEEMGPVNIRRFPYWKLGGESYMSWNFKQAAIDYNPSIIITHAYRHTHSDKAIKIAKELGIPCICVTHAPFVHDRSLPSKIVVEFKDIFSNIDEFDKIIAISKWEIPIIKQLGRGVQPQKIKRIPNPIPDRYYEGSIKPGKGILFLGRYHPIKDLKTLVKGIGGSKHFKSATFVGSGEQTEIEDIQFIERVNKVKIKWNEPVYDIEGKIKILDEHEIFILSSKREAMPIALVEAMARGKIVVASRTDGAKELIQNEHNGFLFEIGNDEELGKILDKINKMSDKSKKLIKEEARKSVDERRMSRVMDEWEKVLVKI